MSKDRSGLYNIHGTIFQVIRGVAGDCLSLGDHDGGTRISGPKPWGGGSIIAEFEVDEEYGPIERLEAENAELRGLLQRTWDAFHGATAYEFVTVKNELRELGVEVDK